MTAIVTVDPRDLAQGLLAVAALVWCFGSGYWQGPTRRRAPRPRTPGAPERRAHYSRRGMAAAAGYASGP